MYRMLIRFLAVAQKSWSGSYDKVGIGQEKVSAVAETQGLNARVQLVSGQTFEESEKEVDYGDDIWYAEHK